MHPIVVFDLDGTLVDTAPDLARSLNHCLDAAGMAPMTLEEVRPHAGHGSRPMLTYAYRTAGRPLDDAEMTAQVARLLEHYEAHIADLSRPFPGVVEAMDRLSDAGYRLAVCTNKSERLAGLLLETLGLSARFSAICGGDTFAQKKPDPSHLWGTIDKAAGNRARAVMVGDTSTDIYAAASAGVASVLVDFGTAADERARQMADIVIPGYVQLDAELVARLIAGRSMSD